MEFAYCKLEIFIPESHLRALQQADGNKKEAAQILEIDRSLLYDKLRRYNLVQDVKDKADT